MFHWSGYPAIRHGDAVIWSPEPNSPPAAQLLGAIYCPKTQSCDVELTLPNGVRTLRHDCWHADDPNCKAAPGIYREPGRGVFRLAPAELEKRDLHERILPAMRREMAEMRREMAELRESAGAAIDDQKLARRGRQPAGV